MEREREAARTRFEKQLKEELEAMQTQRRRLLTDVHDEKERLAQQSAKLRTDLDRVRVHFFNYCISLGNHIHYNYVQYFVTNVPAYTAKVLPYIYCTLNFTLFVVQERTELQHTNNRFVETLKKDYEKMRAELEARHSSELKELKEKLDVEKLVISKCAHRFQRI